jgi:hypothetical protein
LSALRKKLKDPTVPRLTWQLPSRPEAENDNSGYNSGSSATVCSAFEAVNDKGPDNVTQVSGHQAISTDQNIVQATEGASSLMETDTQETDNDHMTFDTTENNYNTLLEVDDNKGSICDSPIFHDMTTDWSHLINSILNNDGANNNFLTTADTDIPANTNSEAVVPSNVTVSPWGVEVNPAETHPDSTATIADPGPLSADMFANSSFVIEPKGCDSKDSPVANEQDGVTSKSIQPQTDDEIMEIGKSLFNTLNIVSTDSTSGSSPDTAVPQTNSGKDKNKFYNTHEAGSFKFQDLTSAHRERKDQNSKIRGRNRFYGKAVDSNARRGQGKFRSMEKPHDGHQKKTVTQRKFEPKANSPHNQNQRLRKQTGKARVHIRNLASYW